MLKFLFQATKLNALVKKYSGDGVVFGSYPSWVNNYYKVRLTVEASSPEVLDQVEKDVKEEFSVLESFDKFPAVNSMEKIQKLLDESKSGTSFWAGSYYHSLEQSTTEYRTNPTFEWSILDGPGRPNTGQICPVF
jgi:hypothetical protein